MKTICLYFEIHQNIHLKRYRFFEIGTDHYYYDDYENERSITETAERSYVPALNTLLEMTKMYGKDFRIALSLSGCAIELLENHAPHVIELLQELSATGCVEFLAEPYSHGLSSLANEDSFKEEVQRMCRKVKELFGQNPKVFRNSSLLYSDEIGYTVSTMGFKGMLTEGAKHVLGWKSPHFLYHCNMNPNLKLLLRDYKLSDDISLRFNNSQWNEYPLFADTYMDWIAALPEEEQVINIFMELCAIGIFQPLSSNILEFLKALPACAKERGMLTEGAKHVLGWKSPHFLYHCNMNPNLKLLLRDYKLSDDISLRFNNSQWNEYPLFADTYMDWIAALPEEEQVINIFMELCAIGIFQPLSSNILEFLKALPACAKERGIRFATPSEIIADTKSVDAVNVPYPMTWVDEERDTSCWLGNLMQREAFDKLYSVADRVRICNDRRLKQDWDYLQATNNFRFMSTKPVNVGGYRGIYDSPYDAFTNYMNIVGDFINRVNNFYPSDIDNEELNALLTTIKNQGEELDVKDKEIARLTTRLKKLEVQSETKKPVGEAQEKPKEKKATKKPAAAKKVAKKA